jgi:hypothetical protein
MANLIAIPALYPKFQTLDTLVTYSPEKAYNLISSYGEQGRQYYAMIELTLDLIYPLISALLFSFVTLYTFHHGFPGFPWTDQLALVPFGILLADYLENACIIIMLVSYPRQLSFVAEISNIFTVIKLALTPFELFFLAGLIGWLIRRIRSGRKTELHARH